MDFSATSLDGKLVKFSIKYCNFKKILSGSKIWSAAQIWAPLGTRYLRFTRLCKNVIASLLYRKNDIKNEFSVEKYLYE